MPWPGRDRRVGALLGFSLSRAFSTTVQGPVSRVDARGRDEPCTTHASGNPAVSLRSRDPSPDAQDHDPGIRQHAGSIEPRMPPSGSDPARNALHERDRASHQPRSPLARLAERLARAPSRRRPTPPAPFTTPSPGEGESRWTSETHRSLNRRPDPTPREAGWRPTPLEVDLAPRCRVGHGAPVARGTALDPTLASRTGGGPPCRQVGRLL
jgi:hypothetical protein